MKEVLYRDEKGRPFARAVRAEREVCWRRTASQKRVRMASPFW